MGIQVEDHLKLVMKIAHRFNNRHETTFDDLYQEGCMALMKAIDDYKEDKGVPFGAFASQRIQFHILSYLNEIDVIRKPRHIVLLANKIRRLELGEEDANYISEKLSEPLSAVKLALEQLKEQFASIDFKVSNDGKYSSYSETLDNHSEDLEVSEQYLLIDNPGFKIKDRDKLLLKLVLEGYSQQEIMEATGFKSVKVVSDKLRRLRIKFKQELVL